jgi:serine/threonine-protein kinase
MSAVSPGLSAAFEDRYRIERLLGEGGMAIVYLAQDLKHDRKVALKVLRPELAALLGAERFVSEIRTTASLQHPHILPLFDSGQAQAGDRVYLYYVMPYVEGETLRQKLDREKQLGVEESVKIARAVATALDYAHRRGIVHRDIKPENVMLFEGQALVADFGIALAISQAGGMRVTETGLSVGTPHYMSPEQAAADRTLDGRTDVYSLGAVMFEMLVGRRPFEASNTPAVMSKIMTEPVPRIRSERPTVPGHVEAAVRVAMAKLPADRFGSAARFADALVEPGFALQEEGNVPRSTTIVPAWRRVLWPGLTAAAAVLAWLGWQRPSASARVARVNIDLPAGQQLAIAPSRSSSFDISPNGERLAYLADSGGTQRIFVRDLNGFESRVLEGTERAFQPFFSPRGDWLAFFRDGSLFRVPVAGGAPIRIGAVSGATFGGSWGRGDRILFATDSGLFLVESIGTAPRKVPLDSARFTRWPQLAPDDRHAFVTTDSGITFVDLAAGTTRRLLTGDYARYVPTGHIVFLNDDRRVRAAPFDLRRGTITGSELPVLDNVFRAPGSGAGFFAIAPEAGTLIYTQASFNKSLVLVDRNGREAAVPAEPRGYRFPSVSPNGRYAAVTVDPRPSDLWIVDLLRGTAERQQTPRHDGWGVWSPDSKRVAMISGDGPGLDWRGYPFTGEAVRIVRSVGPLYPKQWIAGNQILAYTGTDIVVVSIPDGTVRPIVATPFQEQESVLSPDGRWLAYQSDISGITEIYVQAFPGGGERQTISSGGGVDPVWSADGTELYYRRGNTIRAVPARTGQQFQVLGPATDLFSAPYDFTQTGNWTLGPGGRFLMIKADPTMTTRLHVVLNWFEELRAREGTSGAR